MHFSLLSLHLIIHFVRSLKYKYPFFPKYLVKDQPQGLIHENRIEGDLSQGGSGYKWPQWTVNSVAN